jgi:hypothetical protein
MNILFFLGSGVSYKTGLPDTKTITDKLLNGKWYAHTDGNFYPGQNPNDDFRETDITPKIQNFFKYLKEYSDNYYKGRGGFETNYEDIFYIVRQIHNELAHESDNPAINLFIKFLQCKYNFGSNQEFYYFVKILDFKEFIRHCENFINCVVWQSVLTSNEVQGLELLTEVISSKKFDKIDIATLNHDLLIEKQLKNSNISFADGFTEPDGDYCYFAPQIYREAQNKIRLFKLHGSINWYRIRRNYDEIKNQTTDNFAKILRNNWQLRNSSGNIIGSTLEHYPIFLTGTMNKLSDYNFGIINDIHLTFNDALKNHKIIIMSGYSWNDRGINGLLQEWIMLYRERKIILLHEDPDSVKSSKSFMRHMYDNLVKCGKLITVRKWFSDTKLNDIINFIN